MREGAKVSMLSLTKRIPKDIFADTLLENDVGEVLSCIHNLVYIITNLHICSVHYLISLLLI